MVFEVATHLNFRRNICPEDTLLILSVQNSKKTGNNLNKSLYLIQTLLIHNSFLKLPIVMPSMCFCYIDWMVSISVY